MVQAHYASQHEIALVLLLPQSNYSLESDET